MLARAWIIVKPTNYGRDVWIWYDYLGGMKKLEPLVGFNKCCIDKTNHNEYNNLCQVCLSWKGCVSGHVFTKLYPILVSRNTGYEFGSMVYKRPLSAASKPTRARLRLLPFGNPYPLVEPSAAPCDQLTPPFSIFLRGLVRFPASLCIACTQLTLTSYGLLCHFVQLSPC